MANQELSAKVTELMEENARLLRKNEELQRANAALQDELKREKDSKNINRASILSSPPSQPRPAPKSSSIPRDLDDIDIDIDIDLHHFILNILGIPPHSADRSDSHSHTCKYLQDKTNHE